MILIIVDEKVFATHRDEQEADITFRLYPDADNIIKIQSGFPVIPGDPDPSIAHPELVVWSKINSAILPAVFVRVTPSKQFVCAENDTLPFTASIRTGAEPDAPIIPITATWPILFRQKDGLSMDNIMFAFVNGVCESAYHYMAGLPLGEWYVDEKDFDTIELQSVTYAVKLAEPVRFTVYRNL